MFFAMSKIIFALRYDKFAAYSPKYSLFSSLANFQSLIAVIFAIKSPQPLDNNLSGAFDIIFKSAIMHIGVSTFIEYGLFPPLNDTKGLEIPSCDADVGILINGFFLNYSQPFFQCLYIDHRQFLQSFLFFHFLFHFLHIEHFEMMLLLL